MEMETAEPGLRGGRGWVYGRSVQFRVLGPLEVDAGSGPIPLGGPKQRAVLAHLLVRPNQLVPAETLIDEIWGDEPPETARNTLQTYISHLRKALGDGRIVGRPPGYVLTVDPSELDATRFDDLLREARKTQPVDASIGVALLDDALALWRGPALADVAGERSLVAEAARLDELRLVAREERIDGLLASGQHARTIGEVEALLDGHPLRERLWGQLMIALYRDGRQADALGAFQRSREILADELGIDPSPELVRLQERILRQDPALDLVGEPLRGYRLMEKIGEGPTGTVFRGIQPRVGRDVAVKVVHERLAADPAFVRRFEPEAQAVAALEHPHIAPIYDYWRDPGGAYIVSPYLRGGSLRAVEERGGSLEPTRRIRVIQQIASALAFAHQQGVAHGSVRSSNVVLDAEGNAYLCDFRIGIGPEPSPAEDVQEVAALARKMLADQASASLSDLLEGMGVGADAPGAAALVDALGTTAEPDGSRATPSAIEVRNPYKGLRAFAEPDARDFFGRGALVERLVARLNETGTGSRFLAVVGPSGSGKSSVARAGLVPAIRHGALPASESCVVVEMFPGAHPMEELEEALVRVAARPIPSLHDRLAAGSRGLLEAIESVVPTDTEMVLVVDQFEEIFTLTRDEPEREHFLESLRVATADLGSRLRVIVTLRADFYDRPLAYPRFGELLGARTEVVPPLTPDELEQAIRGPAERVGVHPEPGLIAEMIADLAHQPGALPLLQYALTELFERREGNSLTLETYQALGGVTGALTTRAERLHHASGPEGRRAIRQVLLRLVTLGEGREDTRRRVARSELDALEVDPAAIDGVLDAFGRHRLLTFDREPVTREPTIEIAHEALLGSWTRLRGWIDDARENLRLERQMSRAGAEWRASGRDPSFLLRGARLDQVGAWAEGTDLAVGAPEREFLKASADRRESERAENERRLKRESEIEHRSQSRLRALVVVLTVAALVASGLTVVAVTQSGRARREVRIATTRELAAASLNNLDIDPERSILLALQALETTSADGVILREAEEALHRAVQADRLLFTIRHPSTANVDWSPDGRLLVTGGTAGGVDQADAMLWDARTGALVRTLSGHTADIDSVSFSVDGSRVATTAADNQTIVWDTRSGDPLVTVAGLGDRTLGASFSADGRLVSVTAQEDASRLRIVDTSNGKEVLLTDVLDRSWCYPVFSPDGTRVALGACDGGDGAILDATTGRTLIDIRASEGPVASLVYSADGTRIAGASGDEGAVWEARTGERLFTLEGHAGGVIGVAFSPDGTKLATGGYDGTARVWDARTGKQLLALTGHAGIVVLVDFSPDGTRLLTGGGDGTARVWDIAPTGGSEWLTIAESDTLDTVEYSADGSSLLVGGFGGGWLVGSSTGERIQNLPRSWADADLSNDGSTVAASAGGAFELSTSSGEMVRVLLDPSDSDVHSVAYSPNGSLIATGIGQSGVDRSKAVIWDASTGRRVGAFGGPLGRLDAMDSVAFSPDGSLLAGLGGLARLRIWEVSSGDEVLNVQAHSGLATDVAFSPDGASIATAGADGAAVWSVSSGERLVAMAGAGGVHAIAFSLDGALLATGGDDKTARIWDVASGRETLTLYGHGDSVTDVAFSPDGSRLATTSLDFTMRVYALRIEDLVRLARERLTRTFTDQECRQFLHLDGCPVQLTARPTSSAPHDASDTSGPAGAFRVEVTPGDLLRAGLPESEIDSFVGAYTLSLIDGDYRIHREGPNGDTSDRAGTYEIDGSRITFTDRASPECFGSTWSSGWSLRRSLSFADFFGVLTHWCEDFADASMRAVFEAHPWVWVAGSSVKG